MNFIRAPMNAAAAGLRIPSSLISGGQQAHRAFWNLIWRESSSPSGLTAEHRRQLEEIVNHPLPGTPPEEYKLAIKALREAAHSLKTSPQSYNPDHADLRNHVLVVAQHHQDARQSAGFESSIRAARNTEQYRSSAARDIETMHGHITQPVTSTYKAQWTKTAGSGPRVRQS